MDISILMSSMNLARGPCIFLLMSSARCTTLSRSSPVTFVLPSLMMFLASSGVIPGSFPFTIFPPLCPDKP